MQKHINMLKPDKDAIKLITSSFPFGCFWNQFIFKTYKVKSTKDRRWQATTMIFQKETMKENIMQKSPNDKGKDTAVSVESLNKRNSIFKPHDKPLNSQFLKFHLPIISPLEHTRAPNQRPHDTQMSNF